MKFFYDKLIQAERRDCRKEIDINCAAEKNTVLRPAKIVGYTYADDHLDQQTANPANEKHTRIFKILTECFLVEAWNAGYTHSWKQMYKKQRASAATEALYVFTSANKINKPYCITAE